MVDKIGLNPKSPCSKCIKKKCYNNIDKDYIENKVSLCPRGFNIYFSNNVLFIGFIIREEYNEKKVNGYIRAKNNLIKDTDTKKKITLHDFLIDKNSVQLLKIYSEIFDRIKIQRYTIHDIKNQCNRLFDIYNSISFINNKKHLDEVIEILGDLLDETLDKFLEPLNSFDDIDNQIKTLNIIHVFYERIIDGFNRLCNLVLDIKDKYFPNFNDEQVRVFIDSFELIEYRIRRHEQIINNTNIKVGAINLHPIVYKSYKLLKYAANLSSIETKFHSTSRSCYAIGSTDLYLVIISLIENAIKYALPDTIVEITICSNDDSIECKVSNVCEPLRLAELEKLKLHGYQAGNKKIGNGYGLAISSSFLKKCNSGLIINYDNENSIIEFSFALKKSLKNTH